MARLMILLSALLIFVLNRASAQEVTVRRAFPASQNFSLEIPDDWFSTIQDDPLILVDPEDERLYVADSRITFDNWRDGAITGPLLIVYPSPRERWGEVDDSPDAILTRALLLDGSGSNNGVVTGELDGYPTATNSQIIYRAAPYAAMTVILTETQVIHLVYAAPDQDTMAQLQGIVASFQFGALPGMVSTGGTEVGQPGSDFSVALLDGRSVRLADLRGKSVVLNFWATWCEPCHRELPLLSEALQTRPDVAVLAVNFREVPGIINQFVEQYDLGIPVGLDMAGMIADQYRVNALPATFVIDCHGVIEQIPVFEQSTTVDDIQNWISQCETSE